MSEDTPLYKDGEDIYEQSSSVYWWILALVLVYLGLLFGQWVTMLNISPTHTLYSNPAMPGILYSLRYTSRGALALEMIATRVFLVGAILCLIIWRRHRGWSIAWTVLLALCFLAQVFGFFALVGEYADYDKDGNRYGLAADDWFCCAPEHHAVAENFCINALPCGEPVPPGFNRDQTRPNGRFLGLFWVNFVLFLLDVAWIIWFMVLWFLPASAFALDRTESDMPDTRLEKQDTIVPSAPEGADGNVKAKISGHGLRKRAVK